MKRTSNHWRGYQIDRARCAMKRTSNRALYREQKRASMRRRFVESRHQQEACLRISEGAELYNDGIYRYLSIRVIFLRLAWSSVAERRLAASEALRPAMGPDAPRFRETSVGPIISANLSTTVARRKNIYMSYLICVSST